MHLNMYSEKFTYTTQIINQSYLSSSSLLDPAKAKDTLVPLMGPALGFGCVLPSFMNAVLLLSPRLYFEQPHAFLLTDSAHVNTSPVKLSCPASSGCPEESYQMLAYVPNSVLCLPKETVSPLGQGSAPGSYLREYLLTIDYMDSSPGCEKQIW